MEPRDQGRIFAGLGFCLQVWAYICRSGFIFERLGLYFHGISRHLVLYLYVSLCMCRFQLMLIGLGFYEEVRAYICMSELVFTLLGLYVQIRAYISGPGYPGLIFTGLGSYLKVWACISCLSLYLQVWAYICRSGLVFAGLGLCLSGLGRSLGSDWEV